MYHAPHAVQLTVPGLRIQSGMDDRAGPRRFATRG